MRWPLLANFQEFLERRLCRAEYRSEFLAPPLVASPGLIGQRMDDFLPEDLLLSLKEAYIEFAPFVSFRILLICLGLMLDDPLKRHYAVAGMQKPGKYFEQLPLLPLIRMGDNLREDSLGYADR
jgi:hypothetical protein